MKNTRKTILCVVIAVVFVFGCLCVYFAVDYTRRCVKITPKNDITVVQTGKTYNIEQFFDIEREKDTTGRIVEVFWNDGSSENIKIDDAGSFTVTEGTGTLTVSLRDRNADSPEESEETVTVTVESSEALAR